MITNSRAARKAAAKEHNDRIDLAKVVESLRAEIMIKHRVGVAVSCSSSEEMRSDIERLKEILKSDLPPSRPARLVGHSRREAVRIQLAAIAAMAGI